MVSTISSFEGMNTGEFLVQALIAWVEEQMDRGSLPVEVLGTQAGIPVSSTK